MRKEVVKLLFTLSHSERGVLIAIAHYWLRDPSEPSKVETTYDYLRIRFRRSLPRNKLETTIDNMKRKDLITVKDNNISPSKLGSEVILELLREKKFRLDNIPGGM